MTILQEGSKRNKKEKTKQEKARQQKDLTGLEFGEPFTAIEDRVGWGRIIETSAMVPDGHQMIKGIN